MEGTYGTNSCIWNILYSAETAETVFRCIEYNKELLTECSYDSFRNRCIGALQNVKNIQHLILRWHFWRRHWQKSNAYFRIKACVSIHRKYTGIRNKVFKIQPFFELHSNLYFYLFRSILFTSVFSYSSRTWRQAFQKWEMSCSHEMLSGEGCSWNANSCMQNCWKSECIKICRKFKWSKLKTRFKLTSTSELITFFLQLIFVFEKALWIQMDSITNSRTNTFISSCIWQNCRQ